MVRSHVNNIRQSRRFLLPRELWRERRYRRPEGVEDSEPPLAIHAARAPADAGVSGGAARAVASRSSGTASFAHR